jgi:hypothetical protein
MRFSGRLINSFSGGSMARASIWQSVALKKGNQLRAYIESR